MSDEYPTLAEVVDATCDAQSPFRYRGGYGLRYLGRNVEAAWYAARMVRTVEQLDALPLNTVVVDAVGIPRTKRPGNSHMPGGWTHAGNLPLASRELADGRDMVIVWHPSWSRP